MRDAPEQSFTALFDFLDRARGGLQEPEILTGVGFSRVVADLARRRQA